MSVLDPFANIYLKSLAKYHDMNWLNRQRLRVLPFILIQPHREPGLSFHSFKNLFFLPRTVLRYFYLLFICFRKQSDNMLFSSFILLALGSAGISTCATIPEQSSYRSENTLRHLENRQKEAANGKCLAANLTQNASSKTGQEPGTDGIKPGQVPSAT